MAKRPFIQRLLMADADGGGGVVALLREIAGVQESPVGQEVAGCPQRGLPAGHCAPVPFAAFARAHDRFMHR